MPCATGRGQWPGRGDGVEGPGTWAIAGATTARERYRLQVSLPLAIALWCLTAFLAIQVGGFGNTVGYHRLLTHRAFKTKGWVRVLLTLAGATHSGAPMVWVGLHRLHHTKSDGPEDPHSPVGHGFWWAHCGWLIGVENPVICVLFALSGFGQQAKLLVFDLKRIAGVNPPTWRTMCRDLEQERLMRWLDAPFVMPALFAAQLSLAWLAAGWLGIAWLWLVHVLLTNGSWAVNSVAHTLSFGSAPFDNHDQSRDVPWLAALTFGEGFHNAHHRFPRSACHGLLRGPDMSWRLILLLCRLGLASDPWLPKKFRHLAPAAASKEA